MKILIPHPPKDTCCPQWWVLSVVMHRQAGLLVVDIFVRAKWISFQIRRNATIDYPINPEFVRPSRFTSVYIVHPNGGGAHRLKCEECGAEYPFPVAGRMYPCGFCAVERESVVRLWWKPRLSLTAVLDFVASHGQMYAEVRQWPRTVKNVEETV